MKAILAVDRNWAIGIDNKMLYDLKKDLKHFKNTTTGSIVIMGRKTYQSMGSALANRDNLVVSRDKNLKLKDAKVFSDIKEILSYVGDKKAFVIGGSEIVDLFLPYLDGAIITKIDKTAPAKVFLHNFDKDPDFKIISQSEIQNENNINFKYVEYERIKNER